MNLASFFRRPGLFIFALHAGVFSCTAASDARSSSALTFATGQFRLSIGTDGRTTALRLAGEERNWAASSAGTANALAAFSAVTVAGQSFDLTRLAPRAGAPDLFEAQFGASGVTAVYRFKMTDAAVMVELVSLAGPAPESLRFVQLPVAIDEHVGQMINVRWNDHAAFAVMPLTGCVEAAPGGPDRLNATLHADFGLVGQKVAIVGTRPERFYRTVEQVEVDFGLPSPRLDGQWAKTSEDARTSYLFIDLTARNVDEVIRLARLGGFKYVLVYVGTWSTGRGSYAVNATNYPGGEPQLRDVIDRCHAAGLKVGMHVMTVLVGKNDALVHPRPAPGLLKDATAVLAADVDAEARTLIAQEPLVTFARNSTLHGRGGLTVQIDDELIRYESIGSDEKTMLRCIRGYNGTVRAPHRKGARIDHLAEAFSSYVVDPRTPLRDEVGEKIAGVINRCGFDMIYFDGADGLHGLPHMWYYRTQQPLAVLQRVKRDIRVQGGGRSPLSWHWCTVGTCDDYAALAPNDYLDEYKIRRRYENYRDNFLPAELGWWGFVAERPDYSATTPFVVEHHAVRMIAIDAPISLETNLAALRQHGRSEELIALLGRFEQLRLARAVPAALREKMKIGEWHLTDVGGQRAFVPFRVTENRLESGGVLKVDNFGEAQPLRFRLKVLPTFRPFGHPANIALFKPARPFRLPPPARSAELPGALIRRIAYVGSTGDQESVYLVSAERNASETTAKQGLNLLTHRAIGVRLRVTGKPAPTRPMPVLNVQLESITETFREHYIDLNFEGERVVVFWQSDFSRLMREFQEVRPHYLPKRAGYGFNYSSIKALNLRWMRASPDDTQQVEVLGIEGLDEIASPVSRPELQLANGSVLALPVDLRIGESLESAGTELRVFDADGKERAKVAGGVWPRLPEGASEVRLMLASPGAVQLAIEAWGEPQRF